MMRYEEVKMVRMSNIYDYMKKHHDTETAEKVKQWFRVTFDCYHCNCAFYLPVVDWRDISKLLDVEEARDTQGTNYVFEEFYYGRAEEYFYYYLSEVAGVPIHANVVVLL